MSKQEEMIKRIREMTDEELEATLKVIIQMMGNKTAETVTTCPYCGSKTIIKYGRKCGKQRFLCKECRKTFVTTTHTIMYKSHFPINVWKEVITDTVCGKSIDYTAGRLGLYHQAVFDMRHKILMALQELDDVKNVSLGDVSELDETFVLDCYKGKKFGDNMSREPRKHGAKAEKCGISNEYVCICAGIQRNGDAYAATINRAKPSAEELKLLFEHRIADGTLILCDGLRSYNVLPSFANCTVKNCNNNDDGEQCFYHLNNVNGFHSFIKHRYLSYRGVATKYLNRYNALFASAYRNAVALAQRLKSALLSVGIFSIYHTILDTKMTGLLEL